MDYTDYLREMWDEYESEMAQRHDDDYEVNDPQMRKLIETYAFFRQIAAKYNGIVDPFEIAPKKVSSGVTAHFYLFLLDGEDLKQFQTILGNFKSLSIDADMDGEVTISVNIPDVFKKKQQ